MTIREKFVAEARTWLGTPFVYKGREKGVAADCIGLVEGACRNFGIKFPEIPDYPEEPKDRKIYEWGMENLILMPIADAKPGDLFLMRWPEFPIHFAIYSGQGHVIHAINNGNRMPERPERARCVVENWLSPGLQRRIYCAFAIPNVVEQRTGKLHNEFNPYWLAAPGETIADILSERAISTEELAQYLGVTPAFIEALLSGDRLIRYPLARRLSHILGGTPLFWLQRELQYRQGQLRQAEKEAHRAR